MQSWQKDRNYRKLENADGSFTYIITVENVDVEVSADVYKVYTSAERKMEYMERDLKRNRILQDANGKAVNDERGHPVTLPEREVSLDKLLAANWDYPSAEQSPEDAVIERIEIEMLYRGLDCLDDDERDLINALFFEDMTEREYSARSGLPQKTINNRKRKVLEKLRKLLQKN